MQKRGLAVWKIVLFVFVFLLPISMAAVSHPASQVILNGGQNLQDAIGGGLGSKWNNVSGGRIYYNGGNVGIGTTNPLGPIEQLEIANSNGARFIVSNGGGASRRVILLQSPSSTVNYGRLLAHDYGANTGLNLILQDSGGNVGIGINAPSERLDVAGNIQINNKIYFGEDGTGEYIYSQRSGSFPLVFAAGSQDRMVILNNGNVGIGTANPSIKLAIGDDDTGLAWNGDGDIAIRSNNIERIRAAGNGDIWITTGSPGVSRAFIWYGPSLAEGQGSDASLSIVGMGQRTTFIQTGANYGHEGNHLEFNTKKPGDNNDLNDNQLFLSSGGNVGIGTNAPGALLDVEGTIRGNTIVADTYFKLPSHAGPPPGVFCTGEQHAGRMYFDTRTNLRNVCTCVFDQYPANAWTWTTVVRVSGSVAIIQC